MKGGGRHPGAEAKANASVYLTLAVLMLVWVGTASAQSGFILVGPGTQRAQCTNITNPVTNQTWCANGNPPNYDWQVWNGTMWVSITGGGGGGNPALPVGSTQFNNTGAFGGSQAPIHVGAFGTTRAAIQAAIDAAPEGGIVQLECTRYPPSGTLDTTAIVIDKALIFQGCTPGTSYPGRTSLSTSSQLVSAGSNTVINSTTQQQVVFRDFAIVMNGGAPSGGTGIRIGASGPLGSFTFGPYVERVSIYGGGIGVDYVEGQVAQGQIKMSGFFSNTIGIRTGGLHFVTGPGPTDFTNCDGGGHIFNDNFFGGPGGAGTKAMHLINTASVIISNNNAISYENVIHVQVNPVGHACNGPGTTEYQILGNQLAVGGAVGGHAILWESNAYGSGVTQLSNNFMGSGVDDVVKITGPTFGFQILGNTFSSGIQTLAGSIFVDGGSSYTIAGNALATGNRIGATHSNAIVTAITPSTVNLVTGLPVTGTGIPDGTTILTVDSPSQITMTAPATVTGATTLGFGGWGVKVLGAGGVVVSDNVVGPTPTNSSLYQGNQYNLVHTMSAGDVTRLVSLPDVLAGSSAWCPDCVRGSNPCISGGAVGTTGLGTTAYRVGAGPDTVWTCSQGTPTWTNGGLSSSSTALQNRTTLIAMLAALPAAGGRIALPSNAVQIDNTTPITISKPVVIEGANQSSPQGTLLVPSNNAGDLFLVTAGQSVTFRSFTIQSSGPSTAGAYIHINASPDPNTLSVIDDMTLADCFICVDVEGAKQWRVTNSNVLPAASATAIGIQQRSTDSNFGGGEIDHTFFGNGSAVATAIKITSGGFVKIESNQFLGMANHVVVDWTPVAGSLNAIIANNAMEGGSVAATAVSLGTHAGGGAFSLVSVTGNIINNFTAASIIAPAGSLFQLVQITGNTIAVSNGAIGIDWSAANSNIASNQFSGSGTAVGLNIRAAASNTNYCANQFTGTFSSQVTNAGTGTTLCQGIIGGAGAANQVAVWSGASTLTGFTDFLWDDTNHNFVAGLTPSLGAGATNSAILGGTSGSIAAALTNAVSINGGVVTTSTTTAIGGTRLDVPYLASAGQCLKTNASGTVSTGACALACGTQSYAPWGNSSVADGGITGSLNSGTVGQLLCTTFQQTCQATSYTKIAFRVLTVGAAGSQCAVGLYSADGTTAIARSGVQDCASGAAKSTTGLAAFSLVPGTEYLLCQAGSVTATMAIGGVSVSPSMNTLNNVNVLSTTIAQFNDNCTASTTPYACCTGVKTGTCTGLPASLGALSAHSNTAVPWAVVAP